MRDNVTRRQMIPVVAMMLLLGVLALNVNAQYGPPDPKREPVSAASDATIQGGVGSAPPTGYTILYLFSGVANYASQGYEVTVVHCTNIHPATTVDVRVEVFPWNAASIYQATASIPSGGTLTFATRDTLIYAEDAILAPAVPNIFQGSGRVLVKQHTQVICTAQVLDGQSNPPTFMARLTLYDSYGRMVRNLRYVDLPLILR